MEALKVIFGLIQGDYMNFTMAAVAAMLNFSAGVIISKKHFTMEAMLNFSAGSKIKM